MLKVLTPNQAISVYIYPTHLFFPALQSWLVDISEPLPAKGKALISELHIILSCIFDNMFGFGNSDYGSYSTKIV